MTSVVERQFARAGGDAAPELDGLEAAKARLRGAPRRLAGLSGEALIAAVARIEEDYRQFPELEIALSRRVLADDLRTLLGVAPAPASLPLLMACAALDPSPGSPSVAALIDAMARTGDGAGLAGIVAILGRRRRFTCDEIAPALAELCRRDRLPAALALIAEAIGHLDPAPDAAEALGAVLQRILAAAGDAGANPPELARLILSARARVQPPRTPAAPPPDPQLFALAERVADKLPSGNPSPPPLAAVPAARRTGRLDFAEFAAQWPEICGVGDEWLALMKVGRVGERRAAGVCAKPGQSGHLLYGPYVKLGAGDYRVRIRWSAGPPLRGVPRGQPVAAIEAVSRNGKSYLAQCKLLIEDCVRPEHELAFRVTDGVAEATPIEVRVWTSGAVPLTVSSITVERIGSGRRN
jgi:hypothetical protein